MSSYNRIAAVQKAGEILKYLASQKSAVTGPEVARAMGMQVGTVMCHLATLTDLGFVRQVGDGWELGMGLALMWARVKSNLETQREQLDVKLQQISIREDR